MNQQRDISLIQEPIKFAGLLSDIAQNEVKNGGSR